MKLSLELKKAGEFMVIRCKGRVVAGEEVEALENEIRNAFSERADAIVNLTDVQMLDSSGLGALVRIVAVAENSKRKLYLCCLPLIVQKLFELTKLSGHFNIFETEEAALAAGHDLNAPGVNARETSKSKVVCIDSSRNMLSYLESLLRDEGYQVATADNYSDALALLKMAGIKLVLFGPNEFSSSFGSSTRGILPMIPNIPYVMVKENENAAEMADEILKKVNAALSNPAK